MTAKSRMQEFTPAGPMARFPAALVLFLLAAQAPAQDAAGQGKAAQAQPAAASEGFKWGAYEGRSEIEIGYRWVTKAGNNDMYRSMVNLGEGPRLLNSDISLRSPYGSGGLFDRLDFSMRSWGGDPYNSLRLNFGRSDLYNFRAGYRNLNYYNFIPTYANPLLSSGLLLGQHSRNVTYRMTDIELELFPNRKIRPFVGYSRVTNFGPGFTTYSLTGNEFLLQSEYRYSSDEYRGGVQFDFSRFNFTVEQGYRFSRNDTGATDAGMPAGNNPVPFIGQPVTMGNLDRGYHDRTSAPITRILAKVRPAQQLSITGRYVYSMAEIESALSELASGNYVSLENRIVYASAVDAFSGRATSPSHRGNILLEYSPLARLKILSQFDSRNYHVSGSALLASTYSGVRPLIGPAPPVNNVSITSKPSERLDFDLFRNQTEVEYDFGSGLTARTGFRYTQTEAALADSDGRRSDSRSARSVQNTGIFGFSYRQARWLHLAFGYEYNWTDHALTRTDLLDYGQLSLDYRVGPWKNLSLNGRVALLTNENRASDINFSSQYRNYSLGLNYDFQERFNLSLDYSRFTMASDIGILIPESLQPGFSFFREHTDGVGAGLGVGIYRGSRVDFGYRGILSTGSYPLRYHQPWATLTVPVHRNFALKTYWQYYGYNESGASLQDYRGHLITFAVVCRY